VFEMKNAIISVSELPCAGLKKRIQEISASFEEIKKPKG